MSVTNWPPFVRSDEDWKRDLTPDEFAILRGRKTEAAGSGEYNHHYPKSGYYACKGCSLPVYSFAAKYDSGCGWPAYNQCYKSEAMRGSHVNFAKDTDHGRVRLEIKCKLCDGHLGHMFVGHKSGEANERHCVNSKSLRYVDGAAEFAVVTWKTSEGSDANSVGGNVVADGSKFETGTEASKSENYSVSMSGIYTAELKCEIPDELFRELDDVKYDMDHVRNKPLGEGETI